MSRLVNEEDSLVEIFLTKSLVDRLRKRVANSEFKSVSEYVTFILGQLVTKLDEYAPSGRNRPSVS